MNLHRMINATAADDDSTHDSLFRQADSHGVSELHLLSRPEIGLRGIVAIHSTKLGPALGGCRCIAYTDERDAVEDACLLARAMSYKAAITGLPLGGGKSVLLRPERISDPPTYFGAFGRFVDQLGGRYIVAEDMGTGPAEMDLIARETSHVRGTSQDAGDPSPYTAEGVIQGISAAVRHKLGRDSLERLHILVQGAGHVGYQLCRRLVRAGARISVCDPDREASDRIASEFGADLVPPESLFEVSCDVFAPCARGGVIDNELLQRMDTQIIAGSANNQLADATFDRLLHEHGILYAPDYVINAGGLIRVALANDDAVHLRIHALGQTLTRIFEIAQSDGIPTGQVADRLAEQVLCA